MTHPMASRLRITGMNRRAARTRTTYLVSDRLHAERAVHAGDWPAACGICEYLSFDVSIA